jgi:hypothetical protein
MRWDYLPLVILDAGLEVAGEHLGAQWLGHDWSVAM